MVVRPVYYLWYQMRFLFGAVLFVGRAVEEEYSTSILRIGDSGNLVFCDFCGRRLSGRSGDAVLSITKSAHSGVCWMFGGICLASRADILGDR